MFIGLDNYRTLVDDPIFWQSLTNNLWYALGTIPLSIVIALAMALWVNGRLAGRGLLRLAYFTPTVLPMIAVANIWLFFFTPEYGLLEQLTRSFGFATHNWLGSKSHCAAGIDDRHGLEGSRIFHDLLPRGAAVDVAASGRGGARSKALRAGIFSAA